MTEQHDDERQPQPVPDSGRQDDDATAPSDPARPDDPDNGDPHDEDTAEHDTASAAAVEVDADEADVDVHNVREPESDDDGPGRRADGE